MESGSIWGDNKKRLVCDSIKLNFTVHPFTLDLYKNGNLAALTDDVQELNPTNVRCSLDQMTELPMSICSTRFASTPEVRTAAGKL